GDVLAKRFADAAGVAEHQVLLKGFKVFRRDAGVSQQAEAGVDAIDRAPLGQDGGDDRRALLDIGPGGVGQTDRDGAVEDRAKLGEGERVLADNDLSHWWSFAFSPWGRRWAAEPLG